MTDSDMTDSDMNQPPSYFAANVPVPRRSPRRRPSATRSRARALVGGSVAVAVVLAVGGTAYALRGTKSADYRTAAVTTSSVTQSLQQSGTIEPISQATVGFPISGTVATVNVNAGATVATGQVLATLDPTTLQGDLTAQQATLANAQLTLQQALTAATTTTTAATAVTTATTAAATARTSTATSTDSSTTTAAASKAALAVTSAQQSLDSDLAEATTAVKGAVQACSTPTAPAAETAGTTAPTTAAETAGTAPTTAAPSTAAPTTAAASTMASCEPAEETALGDQQLAGQAENALAQAEQAYQQALFPKETSTATVTPATTVTTEDPTTAGTATPDTRQGAAAAVPTAAQLVADQAAVDAAQAQVDAAQQNLAQATIVSPIAGTVAENTLTVGEAVDAQSSTASVIVVGQGGYEVATTVTVADIADLALGDPATVLPDGTGHSLAGKVVWIGVAGTSSGSTTTFPVVVGFTASPTGLGNGASATVSIQTAHAAQALTVPTSAVHTTGDLHTVTTLTNGKVATVVVQVGAVGDDLTQITGGLKLGQLVVLANMNAALPSSNTATSTGGVARTGLTGATAVGGGGFVVTRSAG